ncbi:DNA polymerase III subunit beta, partial [Phocaeicola sp. Sa1YUN3]|nr:DNA polymerase III subunit beta [Phocaeicola faecium]
MNSAPERNEDSKKVEIDSAALADAVAWTTRVIDARPANPILAGIRLEAIDGTLQLSA